MAVCFICCSPDVLDGHNVCAEHHAAWRCHREPCASRRGKDENGKRKSPFGPIYKTKCLDALAVLGGRATSSQIGVVAGYTATQVSASLRAAAGVRYEADPTSTKRSGGFWCLDLDADSESTAFETSEALTA